MKIPFRILVLLLCVPLALHGQWFQWSALDIQMGEDSYLGVVNDDSLVVSDSFSGIVNHSFDGGATWSPFQTILVDSWLFAFDFPTDEVGYGVGGTIWGEYKGVVAKTTDGGATWDTLTTNRGGVHSFDHVKFINADSGLVADASKIFRTLDGGQSFAPVHIVNNVDFFANTALGAGPDGVLFSANKQVVFTPVDANLVYIYRSEDAGQTWSKVYSDTVYDFASDGNISLVYDMHFPTPDTGYAVGGKGLFLKTTDGGLNWTRTYIDPFSKLTALSFTSGEVGYINNDNGIYKTSDGGQTWTNQNVGDSATVIRDIQFASENTGYARSADKLYKIEMRGTTNVSNAKLEPVITIYPNPANSEIRLEYPSDHRIHTVEVIGPLGRTLKIFNIPVTEIDASALPGGNYFLRFHTPHGSTVRKVEIVH